MTKKNVLFGCFGSFFVCLSVVAALTGFNRPTLAGTLSETVTSIGISEEIDGARAPAAAPKPASEPKRKPTLEPNTPAPPAAQQGPTKIEQVAQKLFQSLQAGIFDRSQFTPAWDAVVPKDKDFSEGIMALCKPLLDQFGKPENLGPCQMTGPNSAVFPLQCAKGALIMTVSLDPQEKIAEWRLLIPPGAPAAEQGPAKLEKVAQKLLQSLQSGAFDRSDFSPAWDTVVPKDKDFSEGINALCKPVLDQFGKPENLGPCQMTGPNSAVFPLQCEKGALIMTISLDAQGKIAEWRLLPPPAGQEANAPDIKDFNGFQREINRINIDTRNEEEQWLGPLDKKAELARAIDDLAAAQLRFLRKLAESEHAEQTMKAIDLVLRQRQDRLNKLTTKLQDELRDQRQQQAGERRARTPRATGDRIQDQPPAERPTPRIRRVRDANAVGQQ